jgi:acylphosphatase
MSKDIRAALVKITGRVQGVGYRAWVQGEALDLGLTGWVRNENDGSVQALVVGTDGSVADILERFRKGPPGAIVRSVEQHDTSLAEPPTDFRITK